MGLASQKPLGRCGLASHPRRWPCGPVGTLNKRSSVRRPEAPSSWLEETRRLQEEVAAAGGWRPSAGPCCTFTRCRALLPAPASVGGAPLCLPVGAGSKGSCPCPIQAVDAPIATCVHSLTCGLRATYLAAKSAGAWPPSDLPVPQFPHGVDQDLCVLRCLLQGSGLRVPPRVSWRPSQGLCCRTAST